MSPAVAAALAGRFSSAQASGVDDRLRALANRSRGAVRSAGPFTMTGSVSEGRSPAGCQAVIAGRISDVAAAGTVNPEIWLAAAYEQDGSDALLSLRGEFVAVLWDPRERRGAIARDQLGGRSLHYSATPDGLTFAEDLRDLLALLPRTPDPDRRTVVSLAARGVIPIGRSPFAGVHRLAPGHLLQFDAGGWSERCWWRPRYRGVQRGSDEELRQRVVAGMDKAVGRCTVGGRVAVLLSGGLDSTTVAASATQQAHDESSRPTAYSGVFPGRRSADEAQLIDEVVAFLGIRGVRRIVRGGSPVTGALDHVREWGVPTASPNHFLWQTLLARAHRDGQRVLLDGEGGDEVFGVTTSVVADRIRCGRLLSAVALTRRLSGVGPDAGPRYVTRMLARHGLMRAAPVRLRRLFGGEGADAGPPDWLAPADSESLAADLDRAAQTGREGPLWWRDQVHQLTTMRELLDAHGYLRRRAVGVGLDPRHPFMHDVDLVEIALALPPAPRLDPDYDRILLRDGLRGRIPEAVRMRRGKSHFTTLLQDAMAGEDGALLRELLGDRAAEVRAYVQPSTLDALVLRPCVADAGIAATMTLWRLGNVELWLRTLADPAWTQNCERRLRARPADEFETRLERKPERPFPA